MNSVVARTTQVFVSASSLLANTNDKTSLHIEVEMDVVVTSCTDVDT